MCGGLCAGSPTCAAMGTFLSRIHSSVFEPAFYTRVITQRRRQALWYGIRLALLVVLVSTVANVQRSLQPTSPFVVRMGSLFSGMQIRRGELHSTDTVSRVLLSRADITGTGTSPLQARIPEIILEVEPLRDTTLGERSGGALYTMVRNGIVVGSASSAPAAFSYGSVLGRDDFDFSPASFAGLLRRNLVLLFLFLAVRNSVWIGFELAFSAFFLTFAAYILKGPVRIPFKQCQSCALYALTPVALGIGLQNLAGTSLEIARYVFMMASFVVLFRGTRSIRGQAGHDGRQGEQ